MELQDVERQTLQKILGGIILISLGVHLLSLWLGHVTFEWRWVHLPSHSSIEMAGSLIALIVAFLLIVLEKRNVGTSYNLRIAAALIGMGLMDGFHAVVSPGEYFVWFHSVSTLIGGCLFGLLWLPEKVFDRFIKFWPTIVGASVTIVGLLSLKFSELIPAMVEAGGFTAQAKFMNIAGGLLLLSASLKLLLTYRKNRKSDDLLFSVHCLLFGAAGILFEQSQLWDFTWWGWHVMRLMAYGAAFIFAIDTTIRDQRALRDHQQQLEERVRKRTHQLEIALKEKEVLFQEINHRVKNNMQIITSMLSIQKNQIDDEKNRREIKEILNRIHAMAMVHELLYQSDDLSHLDFQQYTNELVGKLKKTLLKGESSVNIEIDIQPVRLSVDTVVRCGLIQNELITNCIQHAFADDEQGTIQIKFWQDGNHNTLIVKDDGRGMNPEAQPDRDSSFGLNLVQTLVNVDLDGDMEIESNGGTTIRIKFPAE